MDSLDAALGIVTLKLGNLVVVGTMGHFDRQLLLLVSPWTLALDLELFVWLFLLPHYWRHDRQVARLCFVHVRVTWEAASVRVFVGLSGVVAVPGLGCLICVVDVLSMMGKQCCGGHCWRLWVLCEA